MKPAFDTPAIYLITKGEATSDNFSQKRLEILDVVRVAVDAGISLIQLREKALPAKLIYELAAEIAALTRSTSSRVLINDRADIASAAGCDGVQLTSVSLNASVVRESFGAEFMIGVSTHSREEVERARDEGADLAIFGPVFETPGKGVGQGIGELKRACEAVAPFPVLAVGGVCAENVASVLEAGAAGYAAIRWLNDLDELRKIARNN